MNGEYYTLPIPFKKIMELKQVAKCDLQTSIAQKIHLTLITSCGESRFNSRYGCTIWEYDFETIYNINAWKDKAVKAMVETLTANETRLNNISVAIDLIQEEIGKGTKSKVKAIRKKLDIRVTGNLKKTNEVFVFSEPVYVSPISFD